MRIITVDKFSDFKELYGKYNSEQPANRELKNLILLFVANDHPETKQSWCPDCLLAKPIINKMREKFQNNEQIALVCVQVGQRDEWKTPDNPYRLHELKISCVPTIVSLSNGLRLNGSECSDEQKVTHLFSNSL